MLVGAYLCYGLQSQSPRYARFLAVATKGINPNPQNAKKKTAKKLIFGPTPYAKMGSAKKIAKIFFCPLLPILDAAAKFLLIIDSKHPTQKLGFRETLEFARYLWAVCEGAGASKRSHIALFASPLWHALIHVRGGKQRSVVSLPKKFCVRLEER